MDLLEIFPQKHKNTHAKKHTHFMVGVFIANLAREGILKKEEERKSYQI